VQTKAAYLVMHRFILRTKARSPTPVWCGDVDNKTTDVTFYLVVVFSLVAQKQFSSSSSMLMVCVAQCPIIA
jgi:hypothetical protein